MKFSTRIDTDSAASDLFDTVGNFDRIERMLTRRGAVITRIFFRAIFDCHNK